MNKEIKCERCNKIILPEEFRITWMEHEIKPITIDCEYNFHRQCWIEKYNESIDKKVQYMAKQIMKNSAPLIKEFAEKHIQ